MPRAAKRFASPKGTTPPLDSPFLAPLRRGRPTAAPTTPRPIFPSRLNHPPFDKLSVEDLIALKSKERDLVFPQGAYTDLEIHTTIAMLTGKTPKRYQVWATKNLLEGRYILLHAGTGAGKSLLL